MLRLPSGRKMSSFQIIICGFLAVILAGTLLLMLPVSTAQRHWASFETALFTSVSAVCVTGLVVQDTASFWSGFGQFIIMLLIQIGGVVRHQHGGGAVQVLFDSSFQSGAVGALDLHGVPGFETAVFKLHGQLPVQ